MRESAMASTSNEPRRPMNTAVDLEIIRKLASDDLVSLIRKFQGNKVGAFLWYRYEDDDNNVAMLM